MATRKPVALGVDVSTHQSYIAKEEWQQAKRAGYSFAILRAGYGISNPNQIDKQFYNNVENATAAGMKIGAYHYSYAKSKSEAIEEAKFFASILKGIKFQYPVWYDIEDPSQKNLGKTVITDMCLGFCDYMKSQGYYCGIYASLDWVRNRIDMSRIRSAGYDLWIAQYNYQCTYNGDYEMWQNSSTTAVPGIGSAVDVNKCYVDYPSIIVNGGYNNNVKQEGGSSMTITNPTTSGVINMNGKMSYQTFEIGDVEFSNKHIADDYVWYTSDVVIQSNFPDYKSVPCIQVTVKSNAVMDYYITDLDKNRVKVTLSTPYAATVKDVVVCVLAIGE